MFAQPNHSATAKVARSQANSTSDHGAPQSSLRAHNEPTTRDKILSLQKQIHSLEVSKHRAAAEVVSTTCQQLDQFLPAGGFARGTISEWLSDGCGSGAATLSLIAAREICKNGGALVVIDSDHHFFPPAAANWGIELSNTIVIRPENQQDLLWSIHQALACSAVAAVWGFVEEIDEFAFRRFQLAAEEAGCIGLFQRPLAVRGQPSWSDMQLLIKPKPLRSRDLPHGTQSPTEAAFAQAAIEKVSSKETKQPPKQTEPNLAQLQSLFARPKSNERKFQMQLLRCRSAIDGGAIQLQVTDHGELIEATEEKIATPLPCSAEFQSAIQGTSTIQGIQKAPHAQPNQSADNPNSAQKTRA